MESGKESIENEYFDSSSLYVFLYRYKIQILVIVLFSAVVSALVSLNIEEKYKSVAVIYPSNTSSVAKALISPKFGGKADIMEFGEEEKTEQLLEMLNSDKVKRLIIEEFDLMKHYGIIAEETSTPNYDLNEIIEENISFKRNKNMAVEISVLDHSADTAALIANSLLRVLDDVSNQIQKERALQGFGIVKKAYLSLSDEVRRMEDSLAFIMGKGVLDVKSQSEVYGNAYAQAIASGNKKAEDALGEKMSLLSKYGAQNISLTNAIENERLRLSQLKGKYEEAKVDAESRIQNFFVVTSPYAAEKKSYPVRWLIVIISVLAALFTGVISIVLYEQFQKLRTEL